MILDDHVLDVSQFMNYHPGTVFSIQHNIGRDVSKFFNGAYSLENSPESKVPHHTHSNDAKMAAQDLCLYTLNEMARDYLVTVEKYWKANENGSIKSISFGHKIHGDVSSKNPILDFTLIGKYFVVREADDHHGKKRQYTQC